ncbi:Scr1 family TA system antitoxin-like transcriptional regulator [Nocardiopsis dassonvillei]|uniref:Scr1 family TA system antitoxin-like transcriptional regulator n=1 Tax=Nocardiopsis dassonvillei TaxID=2014 RepID=UPI00362F0203
MTLEPDRAQQPRSELAEALRSLRRASGLTGARLAVRSGMSQAKVSKIENGRVLPSVLDVERILRALDVPPGEEEAARLLELARVANTDYQGFRTALQRGLGETQRDLAAIEASASTIRFFLPCMITGLLQTPDYARQTLSHTLVNRGASWETALARRLERQTVLYDEGKRFVFVLTEAALRWPWSRAARFGNRGREPSGRISSCGVTGNSARPRPSRLMRSWAVSVTSTATRPCSRHDSGSSQWNYSEISKGIFPNSLRSWLSTSAAHRTATRPGTCSPRGRGSFHPIR